VPINWGCYPTCLVLVWQELNQYHYLLASKRRYPFMMGVQRCSVDGIGELLASTCDGVAISFLFPYKSSDFSYHAVEHQNFFL